MHRSRVGGGADVVEMLLGAGADADLRDCLGGSALLGAAQAGHHRTIDALTARGAACAPSIVHRHAVGIT